MPQVSVIVTTHNRPRLLERAVESARRAGQDVEVVIVDDASRDETARVCRSLRDVVYVRAERNRGVAGARNLGVMASGADFLTFLDDDDARLPGSLDVQLAALAAAPGAAFVYGQALVVNQAGATVGCYPETCPRGDIFWRLLAQNFVPCGSVVFRKSALLGVGLLDESIPGVDDWDLWVRLAELYEAAAVEQPVVTWRRPTLVSAQGSSDALRLMKLGRRRFCERWLALPRAAASASEREQARSAASRNLSDQLAWEAARAARAGNLRYAGRGALLALGLGPRVSLGVARCWLRMFVKRVSERDAGGAAQGASFGRAGQR